MNRRFVFMMLVIAGGGLLICDMAPGQSSSLYLSRTAPPPPPRTQSGMTPPLIQNTSYAAVLPPEPRRYAVHDLITIIVRESSSASSEASLETNKDVGIDGEVSAFPDLRLSELLEGRFGGGTTEDPPKVGVGFQNDYSGEGEYERSDAITTRITARIIDVKPNGLLALEARTHIRNDDETVTIRLTGYCHADDVAIDNTILSSQMFDLRVEKTHTGELKNASKKGLISKVLDLIFNF